MVVRRMGSDPRANELVGAPSAPSASQDRLCHADEGLNEALLAKDEASELQDEQWQRQQQQQVIVHTPFDLDAFLHFIWERWTALLRESMPGCLRQTALCLMAFPAAWST